MSLQTLVVLVVFVASVSSQTILTLKPDSVVEGMVTFDHWDFYRFVVPAAKGFVLNVQHTANTNHDLDVYVQDGGQTPTRLPGGYVYRDTSLAPNVVIQATARATETIYVAGIYGFKGDRTAYTIQLTISDGCANNCTGHGSCVANTCVCRQGYAGDLCDKNLTRVTINANYSSSIRRNDWNYYSLQVSRTNDLSILVYQNSGDVDIYIRYGSLPTKLFYDYANTTRYSGNFMFFVNITNPVLGLWYIGLYGSGLTTSTYSFKVNEQRNCPMRCSLHGDCVGTRCRCNQGYTGTSCEEKTDNLALGLPYTGYVDSNYWNYYRYSSDSMVPFVVQLTSKNQSDCDIYVKPEQKPTRWNFLFRNISTLSLTELTVYDPGQRLWYIGVFGATSCNYSLSLSQATSCGCVHGSCVQGHCQCNEGWAGDLCDQTVVQLLNSVSSSKANVGNGKWVYYQYNMTNSSQLNVVLRETVTQGMVWLYVSAGHYPDNAVFDEVDISFQSSLKHVTMEFSSPKSATYYIGVYGSPFIVAGSVEFQVVVWATPF